MTDRQTLRRLKVGQKVVSGGVEAERMADGDLRFRIACRIDGQRIHRVIGTERGGMTFPQARAVAENMRSEARAGRLNLPKARKTPLSFAEAAEKYLGVLREAGAPEIERKAQHLKRLVKFLGGIRLDAVSTFALQRYRRMRCAEGMSEASCNRECGVVSHLFTIALREHWIDVRPCAVPRTRESRKPRRLLSDAEVEALLAAAGEDYNHHVFVFVHFALGSAMRHREILAARFDQIDWENCRLVVPVAKAGQRLQPISATLRDILLQEREYADDKDGWIFPSRDAGVGHIRQMSEPFARCVARAGLDPRETTPHALRHLCITRMLQGGADLRTTMVVSGHRSIHSLLHYSWAARPEIDKAVASLDRPNVTRTSPDSVIPLAAEMRKRWGRDTS
jgi:integrase